MVRKSSNPPCVSTPLFYLATPLAIDGIFNVMYHILCTVTTCIAYLSHQKQNQITDFNNIYVVGWGSFSSCNAVMRPINEHHFPAIPVTFALKILRISGRLFSLVTR